VATSFHSKAHTVHTYFCTENSTENLWKKNPGQSGIFKKFTFFFLYSCMPCPFCCYWWPASLNGHKWESEPPITSHTGTPRGGRQCHIKIFHI
jgi:hypothetical protein